MPQYTFYCKACNLEFNKTLPLRDHPSHKCVHCHGEALRCLKGFGFDFASTAATAKANSGVSKHDYPTADNLVGRSSEERWKVLDARNKAKKKLREETGAVALARRDVFEGGKKVSEYTSLGQDQFQARKKLEGSFRRKAEVVGIEQPSLTMPQRPKGA